MCHEMLDKNTIFCRSRKEVCSSAVNIIYDNIIMYDSNPFRKLYFCMYWLGVNIMIDKLPRAIRYSANIVRHYFLVRIRWVLKLNRIKFYSIYPLNIRTSNNWL